MTHNSIPDWHPAVYHKNYNKNKYTDEWNKVKAACLKRDKHTCQRCERRGSENRQEGLIHVTAHHIIPRSDDGGNNLENLITLCDPCHDYVEVHGLKTKVDIIGSYEDEINLGLETAERNHNDEPRTDEGYHFTRPEWHKYVYGGQKRRK